MLTLDCETTEKAELSVATIHIGTSELRKRVAEIGEDDFEPNSDIVIDKWLPMLNSIACCKVPDSRDGVTCWFHATRARDATCFRGGIQPLPERLKKIWQDLYPLVADRLSASEWFAFSRELERDNFGGHGQEVITAWLAEEGPCAFLWAGTAIDADHTSGHDYFRHSELLEFIGVPFQRKYGVSLLERHASVTKPMLIKFFTPGIRAFHLGAVIDHLVHLHRGWGNPFHSPTFSGDGNPIFPNRLLKAMPVIERKRPFPNDQIAYRLSGSEHHVCLMPQTT